MKRGKPRHSEVEQQDEGRWSTGHRYITSGVLQLPQKMVQAVDLYHKVPAAAGCCPSVPTSLDLGAAYFPASAGAPPAYLLARWRHGITMQLHPNLVEWFMALARLGPHLAAILYLSRAARAWPLEAGASPSMEAQHKIFATWRACGLVPTSHTSMSATAKVRPSPS